MVLRTIAAVNVGGDPPLPIAAVPDSDAVAPSAVSSSTPEAADTSTSVLLAASNEKPTLLTEAASPSSPVVVVWRRIVALPTVIP